MRDLEGFHALWGPEIRRGATLKTDGNDPFFLPHITAETIAARMDALIRDRQRGGRPRRTEPFGLPGGSVGMPGKVLAGAMGFMRRHKVISFALALVLILGFLKSLETDDGRRRAAGRDHCGS